MKYKVKTQFAGLREGAPVYPPSNLVAKLIEDGLIEESTNEAAETENKEVKQKGKGKK